MTVSFQHSEYRNFILERTTLTFLNFLIFMPVLVLAPNKGFVNFYLIVKSMLIFKTCIESKFMEHIPRSFLCNSQISRQLARRNAPLVRQKHEYRIKPISERQFCVGKRCSRFHVEVSTSVLALVLSIATFVDFGRRVERRYNFAVPPHFFKVSNATLLIWERFCE